MTFKKKSRLMHTTFHFARYAHPSKENPVLLVVDNHTSHISLQSIEFCRENGIIMISLPPHTTHRMQLLDVAFYGPLKTYYGQACDRFMVNNPGKVITDRNIGHIFGEAYLKAATLEIAINRFQRTGIEPYKKLI
ncbi:DDE superfamily endonuclease [Popillia japonica]|uniref:DDE superfamily endonuclease n=1 Tax=Popillia japonica TaxID=7064 RepID=A0AAW1JFK0_POPJA